MCGIAGIWGRDDVEAVKTMMARARHRGPDARGMHRDFHGVLGHTRLSIMDPEGGDQPIYSAGRKRAIIANGELYNFPALRRDLEAEGYVFRSRSDSESALHLYDLCGRPTARRLDGMFAFAIADGEDLYVARDPIGIKPLYFGRRDGELVFASELKALAGLAEDVQEFPAGTWYHSRTGFEKYYEVPGPQILDLPTQEHCRRIRETLERAVTKRLMSDVPLGAFLSGGLDSSLICAIARQHLDELHTFSVGIEGSRDLLAARRVSQYLDTIHHEYIITRDELREKLPEIVYHLESYDQDLVRSAIPCYFTSRMAAQYVKVILTGEGADELFAGYTYYRDIDCNETLGNELQRSVSSLHNINLQRVDRLTMAHSLEGRVPFLDTAMIELAQQVPAELKMLRRKGERPVEKWVLRKACEDLLPADILWRDKEQFDEGSGTVDIVAECAASYLSADEARTYITEHPVAELRSQEEAAYHKLLTEAYDQPEQVLCNVARWTDRPDDLYEPVGS